MQQVLETGRRVFSAAVAAATIAFSVGAGVLVSPASVSAASAGDLIKGTSLSTVYYYGYDGMRYVFPNEATFMTWFSDFDDVSTISDSALSDISLGGNVVLRPGSWWVKVQSDAKVYAVARDGMIHWIESADVAEDLAGSDWNSRIVDVPDVFFADYTVGTSLMEATAYEGSLYEVGGATYLVWDGEMREVSSAGMSANGLMSKFVLDGANIDDSALTMGDEITSELTALVDVAQTEEGEDDEPAVDGDITISSASSMPVGGTVTGGANSVEVFAFDVEAGSEDATLEGLTLAMTGAGATTNISAAYLYNGATRLTESRTVNSSTREVTFNSLDVEIPAGDEVTLTVKVTVSTSQTAADTFGFEIESADAVTASGDVDGNFPVEGDEFTLSGSDSGTVTITKTGTINDPTIGEDDAEIGEFKLTANSEDANVELITLKVDNASDHDDFNLWDGSTTWLALCENTTGDQVVCDLSEDPFLIEEGDNNIFRLSADIGGQDADTVKVFVDNAIDVVAMGGDFGRGLAVDIDDSNGYDGSSCTASTGKCSFSTVQGGEVTFAFNGPSAGDIQVDAQDQTLLEFSLTAAQEVTVKDLDIIVYGDDDATPDNDATDSGDDSTSDDTGLINTGAEANIKDIKIVNIDTGSVVMGPLELDCVTTVCGADGTQDAVQTIDFTDDFTVEAGETLNLAVIVDVDNTVTSGTEFAAALDVSGLSIEDGNGDALSGSDIVPGSDLTGYNQSAKSASLTIALASTPGDVTTVQGSDSVTMVAFSATAGDASDVTVTDITLSAYGEEDTSDTDSYAVGGETGADVNDFIESCSLYQGSELLAGPEAPASNGQTIVFDSMDWTLEAAEVATLSVKCNLANPSDENSDLFVLDLGDVSEHIVAEDEDGDTVTATGDATNCGGTYSSTVCTTPANVVTIATAGSLTMAVAADMPDADFLRTGSSNNHVATYRFTAANESFTLNTLTFSEEQAEDDMASTNSSAYANNVSVVSIAWDGMESASPSATMSGNEARFSGLEIPVAVDEPTDVEVYVNVPSTNRVSGGSAASNEKVRIGLLLDITNDDGFKAVGDGSGSTLDDDDAGTSIGDNDGIGDDAFSTDAVPTFVVKETYPSIARSSASPSTGVAGGRPEVLRFNVSATSGEDVVMDSMIFKMTATDVGGNEWNECDTPLDGTDDTYLKTGASFDIYDRSNMNTALDTADSDWTLYISTGAPCSSTQADIGFVRITFASDEVVAAGTTKTYSLYMSAAGATADSDSVLFEVVTDPIASSYLTTGVDGTTSLANLINETSVAATDDTITVSSTTQLAVGQLLVLDLDDGADADSSEEIVLVTSLPSSTTMTVVRGYLGSPVAAAADFTANDGLLRLPASFFWKDDGVTGSGGADDFWGSYLVDITDFSGASSVQF